MDAKLSSSRTMSQACLAVSVPAIPMANPTLADLSAGASLVPSPVTATTVVFGGRINVLVSRLQLQRMQVFVSLQTYLDNQEKCGCHDLGTTQRIEPRREKPYSFAYREQASAVEARRQEGR